MSSESESFLDVPCWLNPRITSSIKGTDSLTVFGAGSPLELTLGLFQVLMAFAEKRTPRQAFQMLGVDINIDEFRQLISDFVDHGLLKLDQPVGDGPSLLPRLTPKVFADAALVATVSHWLQQGRAILVPDALPGDFAEEVHRELYRSEDWTLAEGSHDFFHYRASVIDKLESRSPALTECSQMFKSSDTRRFIEELSGQNCAGEAQTAATWYRPGEYALPHDDHSTGNDPRSVAFVWYLTKDWRQQWGGSLFWCPTGQYIVPRFNVLLIFRVIPANLHLICPVAPNATSKRLTINGFWLRSTPQVQTTPISPEMSISLRAYGNPVTEEPEPGPFIVL